MRAAVMFPGLDTRLVIEAPVAVPASAAGAPGAKDAGWFFRAEAALPASRLVFQLGPIAGLRHFTACHRIEPYWMIPRAARLVTEVPGETQFLLAELEDGRWLILVPLVAGMWRWSLRAGQGEAEGGLELLGETGDARTAGTGGLALYAAAGDEPFALIERGAREVAQRLAAEGLPVRRRVEKPLPDFAGGLGWCTWDAFYLQVDTTRVRSGLESWRRGGLIPRFMILDDGWLDTVRMPTGETRLAGFPAKAALGEGGLAGLVRMAKEEFGIGQLLVWHALLGYWGGVDGRTLAGYEVVDQPRHFGEGLLAAQPALNHEYWGSLAGLVPPAHAARFFDDFHGWLRAQGVDGVKVDSQAVLEGLAQGQGGRVALTRAYREALEGSVARHFDGRLINCMACAQEVFYGSPGSTLMRTSIDFWPRRPESHGAHLHANAQVGLWFGEFMQPDWDMFQSSHSWGAFHAAGRALSGGPVYVSDAPGTQDFALLRRLVCSDGTVLRCDLPGRPTVATLCTDPTRDAVPLAIWNRAGAAAMVGLFNARYTADAPAPASGLSGRLGPSSRPSASNMVMLAGDAGPVDVPGFVREDAADGGGGTVAGGRASRFASFAQRAGHVRVLAAHERIGCSLAEGEWELFTFAPIDEELGFAALGLGNMFATPAAIVEVVQAAAGPGAGDGAAGARRVAVTLRDGGDFVAWSARPPRHASVGEAAVEFSHEATTGALRVTLPAGGRQTLTLSW